MSNTMRAIHLTGAGSAASVMSLVNVPVPVPKQGQVLIRVKAIGMNRSEIVLRKTGRIPIGTAVSYPHIAGVEAAGIVEEAPGSEAEFPKGSIVVAAAGGMGVATPGAYAEYICPRKDNVQLVRKEVVDHLGWAGLGALPLMLQTAHGSLFKSLKLKKGDTLLIRGGTCSVGLAAAAIAKAHGCTVISTTRKVNEESSTLLKEAGASHVIEDDGAIKEKVFEIAPGGVKKVLEMVGGRTYMDSVACLAYDGILCGTGVTGGTPEVPTFRSIWQTGKYLTGYGDFTFKPENFPLDELLRQLEEGKMHIPLGRTFRLEELPQAHEYVETSSGRGKVVILVE